MTEWRVPTRTRQLSEIEIFQDLTVREMGAIAAAAPMREVPAGTTVHSPYESQEVLFILKRGRVRIFRVGADGRSLTTALMEPGQIFGEMVLLGEQMADSWAQTLEPCVLCLMSRNDVRRLLLSDTRISARITEHLGRRVAELERRLSDTVLRPVPARIAAALAAMASGEATADPMQPRRGRSVAVRITHEQLADLVGTTRETTTKVLGELRDREVIALRRGRVLVHDPDTLRALAEDHHALADVRTR